MRNTYVIKESYCRDGHNLYASYIAICQGTTGYKMCNSNLTICYMSGCNSNLYAIAMSGDGYIEPHGYMW